MMARYTTPLILRPASVAIIIVALVLAGLRAAAMLDSRGCSACGR